MDGILTLMLVSLVFFLPLLPFYDAELGILLFIRRLLIGMVFFVFHVRTKSYFFGQGLFSGKGGYMVGFTLTTSSPHLPSLFFFSSRCPNHQKDLNHIAGHRAWVWLGQKDYVGTVQTILRLTFQQCNRIASCMSCLYLVPHGTCISYF